VSQYPQACRRWGNQRNLQAAYLLLHSALRAVAMVPIRLHVTACALVTVYL
jgi:hypothetical protein